MAQAIATSHPKLSHRQVMDKARESVIRAERATTKKK